MAAADSNTIGPIGAPVGDSNVVGPVIDTFHPSFEYQAVPKLYSGPQKPLGLGPDPELTGY